MRALGTKNLKSNLKSRTLLDCNWNLYVLFDCISSYLLGIHIHNPCGKRVEAYDGPNTWQWLPLLAKRKTTLPHLYFSRNIGKGRVSEVQRPSIFVDGLCTLVDQYVQSFKLLIPSLQFALPLIPKLVSQLQNTFVNDTRTYQKPGAIWN